MLCYLRLLYCCYSLVKQDIYVRLDLIRKTFNNCASSILQNKLLRSALEAEDILLRALILTSNHTSVASMRVDTPPADLTMVRNNKRDICEVSNPNVQRSAAVMTSRTDWNLD